MPYPFHSNHVTTQTSDLMIEHEGLLHDLPQSATKQPPDRARLRYP